MKHAIPLTICTVAVAGGLFLAVNSHRNYVHSLTIQNARNEVVHAKAKIQAELAAHKQAEVNDAKISKLQSNCREGIVAYNLLLPSQKAALQKSGVGKLDCSL